MPRLRRCPICDVALIHTHQIRLKCQHEFCFNCIYEYTKTKGVLDPCPCPLCRSLYHLNLESKDKRWMKEVKELRAKLRSLEYDNEYLYTMLRFMVDEHTGDY